MRKITTYLFALLFASATFMACDDQFAGQFFADPTVNEQGAVQVGEGFAMALAGDFATPIVLSEEDMEVNTLFQAIRMSQTPALLGENVEFRFTLEASTNSRFEVVPLSSQESGVIALPSISENNIALVSAEDLSAAVVALFGAAPEARTVYVRASAVLVDGSVTVRVPGQAVFPVTVTPLAPILETMFMVGEAIGTWTWTDPEIVELTPVNGTPGAFWTIRYLEAGMQFKFSPVRAWAGDFYRLGDDFGLDVYYEVRGTNLAVLASGFYMIYIDILGNRLGIEPARVYLMGPTSPGGWNAEAPGSQFTTVGQTMVSPTFADDGELRMFASSSIQTSGDWWRREFIVRDGIIEYRGNGGDQHPRVQGLAGQQVVLDFNAGTGVIQ